MNKQIFVNLPVKDLPASMEFFKALGFSFNLQFTNAESTCMVISDTIFAMLLVEGKFASFAPHPICDAKKNTEVLLALSCENRAEVDELVKKAVAAGGTTYKEPQDHGFMYGHGFQDLDGHVWEVFYMDMSAFPKG